MDELDGKLPPGEIVSWEFQELGLFAPLVTAVDGSFIIERCLMNTDQRIVHARETVSRDGAYHLEVVKVLAEGTEAVYYPQYE